MLQIMMKGAKYLVNFTRLYTKKSENQDTKSIVQLVSESVSRLVTLWISNKNDSNKIYKELKGYYKDINIWIIAYKKLAMNKGALTKGPIAETIDGITLKRIEEIKESVLNKTFKWEGVRKIEIPKPGKSTLRPLGIPAFKDKLVQEVLRIILEPIFESSFSDKSHGFRPGRSCHTALRMISRDFKSCIWYIEGDIKKCFDNIDHKLLMEEIRKKVKDKLVLDLIKEGLKAKIYYNNTSTTPTEGTPQGGILSPLLANIMLNKVDQWIENEIKSFDKGDSPKKNKEWTAIQRYADKRKAEGKDVGKLLRNIPRTDPFDDSYKRMRFIRYADDFLIGIRGPMKDAVEFRTKLQDFLKKELNLELSLEKTKITHISEGVKFLGHVLWRKYVFVKSLQSTGKERKRKITILAIDGDKKKLIKKLMDKKLCHMVDNNIIQSLPIFSLIRLPQSEINDKLNQILRGMNEWFKYAGNRRRMISLVAYILRYAAAKTYAAKYKLSSIAQVFKKGRNDLSRALISKKVPLGVTDQLKEKWFKSVNGISYKSEIKGIMFDKYYKIPHPIKIGLSDKWVPEHITLLNKIEELNKEGKPSINKYNSQFLSYLLSESNPDNLINLLSRRLARGIAALNAPCSLCGATEKVEIHHVRKVSEIQAKTAKERYIKSLNIKQIPLCESCHLDIHKGDWKNKPISPKDLSKK